MKRTFFIFLLLIVFLLPTTAQARTMTMYVGGSQISADVESVNGFDMVPIMDIAGALGYHSWCDGKTAIIYDDTMKFTFTLHDPAVFDQYGKEYGLEVVPQLIRNKFMIPANFFSTYLGLPYIWDPVTDAVFLDSEYTYNWLISTEDYQKAQIKKEAGNNFLGKWQYTTPYSRAKKHNIKLQFNEDGTCSYETWRIQGEGTYEYLSADTVLAYFNVYCKDVGKKTYDYYYTEAAYFKFRGDHLVHYSTETANATQEPNKVYYRK